MKILYEDRQLIVCEKPVGTPSEPDGSGKDAIMLASEQSGAKCLPVHRLDRGTGGAMIVAKSAPAASKLSALIQANGVSKEYLAVIDGVPASPEGEYRDLLFRDARKNKSYVVDRMRKGVREALLEYRTLASADAGGKTVSLVLIKLHTGRTHQIRVQFASRKTPLCGDGKYGSTDNRCSAALWSCRISFRHPFSGQEISCVSLPPDAYPWSLFGGAVKEL